MKKKTQRIIVILVAAALILSVLVPALSMIAGASGKITQGDIDNIKNELADITAAKKDAQQRLAAIRGDMSKAKEQVELIQGQITLTEHQIYDSQMLLDQYDLSIQDKEEEIARLEAEEARQYEEFYAQTRWMEETGSVSYLSIFFQASSFSEMLDYITLITDIMDYNNRIITRLEETQRQIGVARDELQVARDAQAEVQAELESQRAELAAQKQEAEALYTEIAQTESKIAQEARQLAADEAAMAKELKEAQQKYAAQIAALNQMSGDWYWPLPGRYRLTSLFGGRPDPFTGKPDNHTGTDVGAPAGVEIHAAQEGVVTTIGSNRYSSYGYYCMITHANGYVTLYAHMNTLPIVKAGQTVSKGQVIGYVGSTGRSTGPHLHFELRVNGVRGDVLKLYPGMTFTSPKGASMKGG